MSQGYSSSSGVLREIVTPTEQDLTSAGVLLSVTTGSCRFTATSVAVIIGDDTVGVSTVTVERYKTLDNGGADAVTLGTLTIPTATVAGSVYVLELTEDIEPGESVVVSNDVTPSTGTGTAVVTGYSSPVLFDSTGVAKANSGTGKVYKVTS